jgi:translation elongation factor EF-Tu-like GTPase
MSKFVAKIRLLSTSEGGRKGGIISGYRPNASFAESVNTDVQFELLYNSQLNPGEEGTVSLKPLNFSSIEPFLHFGSQFIIREGSKIIGQGIVLEIVKDAETLILKK